MIRTRTTAALALGLTLAAGTALAQSSTHTSPDANGGSASPSLATPGPGGASHDGNGANPSLGTPGPASASSSANHNDAASNRNPVLTDAENVRASKVIGSSVYNDKDEKIGTVDDLILDKNHRASGVVLSVGGFLGLGAKLVEVPYEKLQFGDTRQSSENRVKLPGATKDSLEGMPAYNYGNANG